MVDNTPWKWNYFTLESICKAKCGLCDEYKRPAINRQKLLKNHLIQTNKKAHKEAIKKFNSSRPSEPIRHHLDDVNWDFYYETIHLTDDILNPKIKCEYCEHIMSIQGGGTEIRKRAFLKLSPEMVSHLTEKHKINHDNWRDLNNWIKDNAASYCNTRKSGPITVYTCKECVNDDNEGRAKNAIMFAKHMIDKHRDDEEFKRTFSWDNIPKELLPLYSTVREDTTLSSSIADRPGPSRLNDPGKTESSSQKSPSKRKGQRPRKVVRSSEEHSSKRKKDSST